MSSNSPGHGPDTPIDASAFARNNEDTDTPPQQGENTVADRDNPAANEVSSNGIDPAQGAEVSTEEPDHILQDIGQFNIAEIIHDSDESIEDAFAELFSILAGTDSEDLLSGYVGLEEVDNNVDSSWYEEVLNSSLEEKIDSSEHTGDSEIDISHNASLKSGDTPYNKEDNKAAHAFKPTLEESSSPIKKRKRGPYKCRRCGKPKRVKAPNGQLIPHRCQNLEERVKSWKRRYKDKISAEKLQALFHEAVRRYGNENSATERLQAFVTEDQTIIQADATANSQREAIGGGLLPSAGQSSNENSRYQTESSASLPQQSERKKLSTPTSYMKKWKPPERTEGGYQCGRCGARPKVGHDCPYCKECGSLKDGPDCHCERKPAARRSNNTTSGSQKRAKQSVKGCERKPGASKRQVVEEDSPKTQPEVSPNEEQTDGDDQKPAAESRLVSVAADDTRTSETAEGTDLINEERHSKRRKKSQVHATSTAESAEETAIPDSTQGSTNTLQQESVASPTPNEGAEQGPAQLDSGSHQSTQSQNGTPKGNETDDDFEEV